LAIAVVLSGNAEATIDDGEIVQMEEYMVYYILPE